MADAPTPPPKAPTHPRSIRSFVVRAGRMGPGQSRALAELGPRFVIPYAPQRHDFDASFGRHAPRVLEIGFGMGDATATIAQGLPDTDFIGVEVHTPGVGALLKRIGEIGLANLRLIQADFVRLLASRLKSGAYLHCATDWQPYAEQMLEVLTAEPSLRNSAEGYAPKPDYRPLTKFENRGLTLGHGVWDLVFVKRP